MNFFMAFKRPPKLPHFCDMAQNIEIKLPQAASFQSKAALDGVLTPFEAASRRIESIHDEAALDGVLTPINLPHHSPLKGEDPALESAGFPHFG